MSDIGSITYGELPSCCSKHNSAAKPPSLGEGGTYVAAVDIYDASPVWVEFAIRNSKAVVIQTSDGRGR